MVESSVTITTHDPQGRTQTTLRTTGDLDLAMAQAVIAHDGELGQGITELAADFIVWLAEEVEDDTPEWVELCDAAGKMSRLAAERRREFRKECGGPVVL
jgi:hypothetical protein